MKLVSQALRDSAKGQDCTLRLPGVCSFNREQTVLAHLPVNQRGTSIKSPDLFAVFACAWCHDRLDRRDGSDGVECSDQLRALCETQAKWIEMGLLQVAGDQVGNRRNSSTARPSKILARRSA